MINHELLAEYAGDPNIKRPVIAKVHRGIFFDPLNQPEETNGLKGIWRDVLASVFQSYTPIVIGYGGGDNSLMNFLEDSELKMKNGIYWCYFEKYGLPSEKIQRLIKDKNGYLVRTAGFDATMLAFGNALFPDKIGVHEAEEYLNRRTSEQIANYEKEYKRLTEQEHLNTEKNAAGPINESENEFKQEIEKMMERTAATEKERKERNRMTAWDYNRQGDRYYDLEQYEEAVKSYTEAIQLQANNSMFYNSRGCAYDNLGEYNKAISDYNVAIAIGPLNAVFYYNRGHSYDKLEEYDKAISDYTRAIELSPNNATAYNNRGSIYIVLGRTDEAISDFNKAIELNSKFANPYKHLGNIYKEQSDYTRSIEFLSKAIELNLEYKDAYLLRAEVYRLLGETEKAAADEEMAKKL